MEMKNSAVIFVVEDNLLYQNMVAKSLSAIAGEIYFFTSGEACLDWLDRKPTVIVMDYNLEGKLNGLETIRIIRNDYSTIPIILFSNEGGLDSEENNLCYGPFDFLPKSLESVEKLRQMIVSPQLHIAKIAG